jgi:hypothetical protein
VPDKQTTKALRGGGGGGGELLRHVVLLELAYLAKNSSTGQDRPMARD